jgi:hypothetical protein
MFSAQISSYWLPEVARPFSQADREKSESLLDAIRRLLKLDLVLETVDEETRLMVRCVAPHDFIHWHHQMTDLFPDDGAVMFGKKTDSLVLAYTLIRMQVSIYDFILYCADGLISYDSVHNNFIFAIPLPGRNERFHELVQKLEQWARPIAQSESEDSA